MTNILASHTETGGELMTSAADRDIVTRHPLGGQSDAIALLRDLLHLGIMIGVAPG